MEKWFLICDDSVGMLENYFRGRIIRKDNELIEPLQKLEIGQEYQLSKTRYLVREK